MPVLSSEHTSKSKSPLPLILQPVNDRIICMLVSQKVDEIQFFSTKHMNQDFLELLKEPYQLDKWEKLIETVEHNNGKGITKLIDHEKLQNIRNIYHTFLDNYPLLVNYWIRFANLEYELGNFDKAAAVYDQGFRYLSYCIDLWVSFLRFKISTTPITRTTLQEILQVFEEARLKIGFHYHAADFYKLYLDFLDNYREVEPSYHKKHEILLRHVIELPVYNYHYFFQLILKLNKDSKLKFINHRQSPSSFKKTLIDVYITTQYKSHKLYQFEKDVRTYYDYKFLSQTEIEQISRYLDYLELNFPEKYVVQAYERFAIVSASYDAIWNKYVEHLIAKRRVLQAENVLKRWIKLKRFNTEKALIRLVDLKIYEHDFVAARDLLVHCSSLQAVEKLLALEWLFNYGDGERLLQLFDKVVAHNDYFFTVILYFNISNQLKYDMFKNHYENFKESPNYKTALNTWLRFNAKYSKEFAKAEPKTFDEVMATYR